MILQEARRAPEVEETHKDPYQKATQEAEQRTHDVLVSNAEKISLLNSQLYLEFGNSLHGIDPAKYPPYSSATKSEPEQENSTHSKYLFVSHACLFSYIARKHVNKEIGGIWRHRTNKGKSARLTMEQAARHLTENSNARKSGPDAYHKVRQTRRA
jgi:hypothetical protein